MHLVESIEGKELHVVDFNRLHTAVWVQKLLHMSINGHLHTEQERLTQQECCTAGLTARLERLVQPLSIARCHAHIGNLQGAAVVCVQWCVVLTVSVWRGACKLLRALVQNSMHKWVRCDCISNQHASTYDRHTSHA